MRKLQALPSLIFFTCIFFSVVVYLSCRKQEQSASDAVHTEKKGFFDTKEITDPAVAGIANALNRENEKMPFAQAMVRNAGWPQWNAALIKTATTARQLDNSIVVNIPLITKGATATTIT